MLDGELGEALCGWAARSAAAECRWLAALAEFDRREGWYLDGQLAAVDWLVWRCGMSARTADAGAEVDREVLGVAEAGTVADLDRAVRHWQSLADQDRGRRLPAPLRAPGRAGGPQLDRSRRPSGGPTAAPCQRRPCGGWPATAGWCATCCGAAASPRRRHPHPGVDHRPQRRSIAVRDHGRCRFVGCERRRRDVHHVGHLAHGGPTDVASPPHGRPRGRLPHHRRGNGTLTFHRPDGSVVGSTTARRAERAA